MNARPLYSIEAEQAVIGALLLDNNAFELVADIIAESDFWGDSHRVLYHHVAALLGAGRQADAATITASLQQADDLDRIGGSQYLEAIYLAVPSSRGAANYARIVRDHRIERDLAAAAEALGELSRDKGPVSDRLDAAQRLIFGLGEGGSSEEPPTIREVLADFVEDLEARVERGGEISGLPTSLERLDDLLDGLQKGDLIILGGRPAMGKTALSAQIADGAALAGKSVLVFSMEMSARQWAQRSVSRIGRIDSHKLRSGKLVGDDWERLSSAVGQLHERKLVIDDRGSLSVERMRARARRLKRKQGLDLVVIDYLQLMTGDGDNRNEQLSGITRNLKLMAKELDCPVLALSQLSRECEKRPNKRPLMSDLRDSGGIEQDADVIVFVYRDEVYNVDSEAKGTAELLIRKCRMGAIGEVRVAWLGEYTTFENWTGGDIVQYEPTPQAGRRTAFLDS